MVMAGLSDQKESSGIASGISVSEDRMALSKKDGETELVDATGSMVANLSSESLSVYSRLLG